MRRNDLDGFVAENLQLLLTYAHALTGNEPAARRLVERSLVKATGRRGARSVEQVKGEIVRRYLRLVDSTAVEPGGLRPRARAVMVLREVDGLADSHTLTARDRCF